MKNSIKLVFIFLLSVCISSNALGSVAGPAIREASEYILKKFGKGIAGQTVEEISEVTTKAVAKYGDDALPLLRKSGHAGFTALKEAGEQAPDVIKLYAKKGDEAVWIISEPKKLAIFIKHGNNAADALLKHPGISDTLIRSYGENAIGALNNLSRKSAQRLSMVADDGLLTVSTRSPELLKVIRQYGDASMDFIWRNKGALAVTSALVSFLDDPQVYISGTKELVVDLVKPIVPYTNWTLIICGLLFILFLPSITRSILKVRRSFKKHKLTKDLI